MLKFFSAYFNFDFNNSYKYLKIVAELKNIKAIHYLIDLKNNDNFKNNNFDIRKKYNEELEKRFYDSVLFVYFHYLIKSANKLSIVIQSIDERHILFRSPLIFSLPLFGIFDKRFNLIGMFFNVLFWLPVLFDKS